MFFVYVLQNPRGNFYVGQTENLDQRIREHNDALAPRSKYTIKNGLWKLVWSESRPDRASAMVREKQIKSMKSARWIRENLLASDE